LRTSFHFAPNVGQWAQIIHSVIDFKWSQVQQTRLSPSAAADLISSLSFDQQSLARPPLHFRHISSTQGDYLIVVLHHALYDGIAIPKLLRYVKQLYHGNQIQPPVPFHHIADAILAQEKEGTKYWTQALAGVTPWHFPRAPQPSDDAWRASVALDVSSGEIHRFCRRYHVHPQCIGQASWAKILCRRSKLSEVVFGQVISGRTLPDADDVIGPVFVSLLNCFIPRPYSLQYRTPSRARSRFCVGRQINSWCARFMPGIMMVFHGSMLHFEAFSASLVSPTCWTLYFCSNLILHSLTKIRSG